MRFQLLHKASSYGMILFAFLALALSGELDPVTIVVSCLGFAASWYWEPPRVRPERWVPVWNTLAVVGLVFTGFSVFTGPEVVLPVTRFMLLLLGAKLFSRIKSRDYLWCYTLAFGILTASTALNGSLSFALCFLGFSVFSTWALILFHLRREMEDNFLLRHGEDGAERASAERVLSSRRIVGARFLFGTACLSIGIFMGAGLLFFMFPRIGFGLFFKKSRAGINMAGFSENVELGGHGTIRDDETVVMRISTSDPRLRGRIEHIHWRGIAFEQYQDGRWLRGRDLPDSPAIKSYDEKGLRIYLSTFITRTWAPTSDSVSRPMLPATLVGAAEQEIYLEPLDSSVLFGASDPLAFSLEPNFVGPRQGYARAGKNDEVRFAHTAGIKYRVFSRLDPPSQALLESAPPADPELTKRYLALPPELPTTIAELGARIVADANATTPYTKSMAIMTHLKRNYGYTLQMQTDPTREPLEYFLLERKKGHCEYFASAMAVLLRTVGVPTRQVNGFLGGEWNEYGQYIAVRSGDAHSWVEVWLDGAGWVTFDPTPEGAVTRVNRGLSAMDKARRFLDSLRLGWFKWVIEYDLGRQLGFLRQASNLFQSTRSSAAEGQKAVGDGLKRHGALFAGLALLLVAGAAFWSWRRRETDAVRSTERTGEPATKAYRRALRALTKQGQGPVHGATALEHAERLAQSRAPFAREFLELALLHYRAQYGQGSSMSDPPDPVRAEVLASGIIQALEAARRAARSQPRE